MNELPPAWSHLRKNKRTIVLFVLSDPYHLWSYPYFVEKLCKTNLMSERRLRSNLKSLVDEGILGIIVTENGGVFYGLPHVANDPLIRDTSRAADCARGGVSVSLKVKCRTMSLEEMIEKLREAKAKPVIRPTGRSAKLRRAQFKNYTTAIEWQIDDLKQQIAKKELLRRQQEIADKYSPRQN